MLKMEKKIFNRDKECLQRPHQHTWHNGGKNQWTWRLVKSSIHMETPKNGEEGLKSDVHGTISVSLILRVSEEKRERGKLYI